MYMKAKHSLTVSDMYGTKFKEKNKHDDNHICIYYRSACCYLSNGSKPYNALKNSYSYFIGTGTIVATTVTVAALIFAAETFF